MLALTNVSLGSNMRIVARPLKLLCKKKKGNPIFDRAVHHATPSNSFLREFLCLLSILHIHSRSIEAYGFNYQAEAEDMQSYSFVLTFLMKFIPSSNMCQIIVLHHDIKHGPGEVWLIENGAFLLLTACLFSRKLICFGKKTKPHNPV